MEEALENGKESPHSAHANGMNERNEQHMWRFPVLNFTEISQETGTVRIQIYLHPQAENESQWVNFRNTHTFSKTHTKFH